MAGRGSTGTTGKADTWLAAGASPSRAGTGFLGKFTEIPSFAKPHILVQQVCECVVILKGLKGVSWKGAKAMMTDTNFLKSLIDFDKDGITDKQVRAVMAYMKNKQFTPESLMEISGAGAGLLKWVFAVIN